MFDKLICECLRVLSDTGETDPASLPSTLWGSASPGDEGTFSDRRGWKKKLGMARSASWSSSDPVYAPGTTCSALLPALEKGLPLRRLSVSNNAKDKVSKPGARDHSKPDQPFISYLCFSSRLLPHSGEDEKKRGAFCIGQLKPQTLTIKRFFKYSSLQCHLNSIFAPSRQKLRIRKMTLNGIYILCLYCEVF